MMDVPEKPLLLKHFVIAENPSFIANKTVYCMSQLSNKSDIEETSPDYNQNFEQLLANEFPKKTLNRTWQTRWFSLTPTRLIYFIDKSKNELKGCFNLISLTEYDLRLKASYPIITLTVSVPTPKLVEQKQLIQIRIDSWKNFLKWRDALTQIISKNAGGTYFPKVELQSISSPKQVVKHANFWNKIMISNKEFLSYANHLDIIFMRSKAGAIKFQRLFMRSYYDHIGIVVKDETNNIFFLQAIQSRGVWINKWEEIFPTLKKTYDEIGYRKLHLSQGQVLNQQKLEELLNQLIGVKYELSLGKLLQDDNYSQKFKQGKTNGERTFFCSQLVAYLYKKMELLKGKKKNQYWPKDFQENISLQKGAFLSTLMTIDLFSI